MVISTIIAFLLDPVVTLFVRLRLPRPLSSLVVCGIALVILYLIGLGAWTEIAGLVEDLPNYSGRIDAIADAVATSMDQVEKNTIKVIVPKRFRRRNLPRLRPPLPRSTTIAAGTPAACDRLRRRHQQFPRSASIRSPRRCFHFSTAMSVHLRFRADGQFRAVRRCISC